VPFLALAPTGELALTYPNGRADFDPGPQQVVLRPDAAGDPVLVGADVDDAYTPVYAFNEIGCLVWRGHHSDGVYVRTTDDTVPGLYLGQCAGKSPLFVVALGPLKFAAASICGREVATDGSVRYELRWYRTVTIDASVTPADIRVSPPKPITAVPGVDKASNTILDWDGDPDHEPVWAEAHVAEEIEGLTVSFARRIGGRVAAVDAQTGVNQAVLLDVANVWSIVKASDQAVLFPPQLDDSGAVALYPAELVPLADTLTRPMPAAPTPPVEPDEPTPTPITRPLLAACYVHKAHLVPQLNVPGNCCIPIPTNPDGRVEIATFAPDPTDYLRYCGEEHASTDPLEGVIDRLRPGADAAGKGLGVYQDSWPLRPSVLAKVQDHDVIEPMWRLKPGESIADFKARIRIDVLLADDFHVAPLIDLTTLNGTETEARVVNATKAALTIIAESPRVFGVCPFGIGRGAVAAAVEVLRACVADCPLPPAPVFESESGGGQVEDEMSQEQRLLEKFFAQPCVTGAKALGVSGPSWRHAYQRIVEVISWFEQEINRRPTDGEFLIIHNSRFTPQPNNPDDSARAQPPGTDGPAWNETECREWIRRQA
jgi:hypothetical protein